GRAAQLGRAQDPVAVAVEVAEESVEGVLPGGGEGTPLDLQVQPQPEGPALVAEVHVLLVAGQGGGPGRRRVGGQAGQGAGGQEDEARGGAGGVHAQASTTGRRIRVIRGPWRGDPGPTPPARHGHAVRRGGGSGPVAGGGATDDTEY